MNEPQCFSPFSGNSNVICLRKISTEVIADRWLKEMGISLSSSFRKIGTIYHWRCLETSFEWYTPRTAAGDAAFYEQLSQRPEGYYSQEDKWEFRVALDYIQKEDKVLEVGIGNARFLSLARKYCIQVEGVEINPFAARRARELGFVVYQIDVSSLVENLAEKYDVVCSFHVLEHVPNPVEHISTLLKLLRHGGKLILSVPNRDVLHSFLIDPRYELLLDQPPHHMSHWNEKTFRCLPNLFSISIESIAFEPLIGHHINWPTVTYVRNQLKKYLGISESLSIFIANRYTLGLVSKLLKLKYKTLFRGQSILVVLRKTELIK
ncbi:class I SAM-dependent methyltransferase [Thermosynechococcus sp.]|uniref:class I SAM-dependent methyltransferase n=1 Tax=Thermosynechococcus sp. TaxID=2814275 RepID=UPI00391897C1